MVTFMGDAGLLFLKCSCWRCWGTDTLAGKHIHIEAAEQSQSENGWTLRIQMLSVVLSHQYSREQQHSSPFGLRC